MKTYIEKLAEDPTKELHKELVDLWVYAKENNFVTPKVAKDVMGISNNLKGDGTGPTNRLSTLPHYRPGQAYFYASLKIHKCKREELKPGVEPPIRLITALQDGISKRSDVFLACSVLWFVGDTMYMFQPQVQFSRIFHLLLSHSGDKNIPLVS